MRLAVNEEARKIFPHPHCHRGALQRFLDNKISS
jgi:hypothetical protein